jgi:hypothetical protein
MENALTVFGSILGGSAFSVLVVFILRTWISERIKNSIKHEYEKEMELYKAVNQRDLEHRKAEYQGDVERLKSELAVAAAMRQIRFSHLHERSAKIVAGTWRKLCRVQEALRAYVAVATYESMGTQKERRQKLAERFGDFQDYFNARRPYLPKHLAQSIQHFPNESWETTFQFMINVESDDIGLPPKERYQKWNEIAASVNTEISSLLSGLEDKFREMLGVDENVPRKA